MDHRFYVRRFLNLPHQHAGAYILAEVEETKPDDSSGTIPTVTLELTDCIRRVNFEFPLWDDDDRRNSIHKARLLARELARFADALEAEIHLITAREARDAEPEPEKPAAPTRRAERRGRPGHGQRLRREPSRAST